MKILVIIATLGVVNAGGPKWQHGTSGLTVRAKPPPAFHLAESLRMLRSSIKIKSRGTRQSYPSPPSRHVIRSGSTGPSFRQIATVQPHGLSASFRVPNPMGGYGPPSGPSADYGVPSSTSPSVFEYGAPSAPPLVSYGTPSPSPAGDYGAPSAPPAEAYGAPSAPPAEVYGAPSAPPSGPPSDQYGPPSDQYGPPSNSVPAEVYGTPLPPGREYGAPPPHFAAPLSIAPDNSGGYGLPPAFAAQMNNPGPIHNEVFNQNPNQGGPRPNSGSEDELEPIIHKHVFVHVAPEEPKQFSQKLKSRQRKRPEKHYRILFIKAPSQESEKSQIDISSLIAPQEHKTLVYVLIKKPEDQSAAIQAQLEAASQPTTPSKPEVYFIKYKNEGELAGVGVGGPSGEGATGPSNGGGISDGGSLGGGPIIEAN